MVTSQEKGIQIQGGQRPSPEGKYDRQILMIGTDGQDLLLQSSVTVVGCGGLGQPVLAYLVAAGIGKITMIDNDQVMPSNLNRCILSSMTDPDQKFTKINSIIGRLHYLESPEQEIRPLKGRITEANYGELLSGSEVVVDCTDNLETRYILNKYCMDNGVPLVTAGVQGFTGTVRTIIPGESACLYCLYHGNGGSSGYQKCSIIGSTCGVIGSIQATEVIKLLLKVGGTLSNRVFLYDGKTMSFIQHILRRDPKCPVCGNQRRKKDDPS